MSDPNDRNLGPEVTQPRVGIFLPRQKCRSSHPDSRSRGAPARTPPQHNPADAVSTSFSSCPTTCGPNSPATTAASMRTAPYSTVLLPGEFAFHRNYCQFPRSCPEHRSSPAIHPTPPRFLATLPACAICIRTCWITLPQLFREHSYTTLRSWSFYAGLDDHKAWTDFYGDVESMYRRCRPASPWTFHTSASPCQTACFLCSQPAANSLHSDEIIVLPDGNGEGGATPRSRTGLF